MPEVSDRPGIVLDTHVWLWWSAGSNLADGTRDAIDEAARRGAVYIPAISVWEVAMLVAKGRLTFSEPVQTWCQRGLRLPGFNLAHLTPEIAIESCQLPGGLHQDPADRMIVSTARALRAQLVTRDEKLLAYGAAGHVDVITA